ncbi:hypothetical protein [Lacinutrix jangbogonensis]|uniref:hypothetical protein n=1 Tax=Lacinutrix jangbogonensis TaxID=1469557 RepID=UPI00053DAA95|nr:hypothetical protein [Lacinutrix jangbogonensis]
MKYTKVIHEHLKNSREVSKKLKKISFLLLLALTFSSIVFVSCQNEEVNPEQELTQIDSDASKIDKLLVDYKSNLVKKASTLKDDQIITFEVVKNLKTGEITIQNQKVVSFFPIDEKSTYYNKISDSYQVSCDRGGGGSDDWSKDCDGKWSCGKLIAACLDEGGCSTICEQEMSKTGNIEKLYSSVEITYIPVK